MPILLVEILPGIEISPYMIDTVKETRRPSSGGSAPTDVVIVTMASGLVHEIPDCTLVDFKNIVNAAVDADISRTINLSPLTLDVPDIHVPQEFYKRVRPDGALEDAKPRKK